MAVIDEFYNSARNPGVPALSAWLGSFLGERERMNRELLAQQLREAAGGDDAKLLEIEASLRERSGKIAKAIADYQQGKMDSLVDLAKLATSAENVRVQAAGRASQTTAEQRGAGERKQMDIAADSAAAMQYDAGLRGRVETIGRDASTQTGDQRSLEAIDAAVKGVILDAGADKPGRDLALLAIKRDVIKEIRKTNPALADIYAEHALRARRSPSGLDPEDEAVKQSTGLMSPEQVDKYNRDVSAGIPGQSAFLTDLLAGARREVEDADEAGESSTRTESRTTTPREDETGTDTEGPPLDITGLKIRGAGPAAASAVRAAQEAANRGDRAGALEALARAQEGVEQQIASVEAERRKSKPGVRVGSNYLLDNPFTYTKLPEARDFAMEGVWQPEQTSPRVWGGSLVSEEPGYRGGFNRMSYERENPEVAKTTDADESATTRAAGIAKKRQAIKDHMIKTASGDRTGEALQTYLRRVEALPDEQVETMYQAYVGGEASDGG